jgi:cytidylate kinase
MAIITISREMGSGGIPIVQSAAEELGYTLVDGDTIASVALEYGLSLDLLAAVDEKPLAFLDKADKNLEVAQRQVELIILEYALAGNIIVYGRGGQDLLTGVDNILRVRITAPFEERVERWAEREWLDPELARILVRRSDQQRAGFIKYYFDRDWTDPLSYDLVINTSRLTEETAIKLICEGVKDQNLLEMKDGAKKILRDKILAKRAEIKLLSSGLLHGLHYYHFHLDVVDGVAALGGHVHSNQQRTEVHKILRTVEGIKEIIDHLEIRAYETTPQEN